MHTMSQNTSTLLHAVFSASPLTFVLHEPLPAACYLPNAIQAHKSYIRERLSTLCKWGTKTAFPLLSFARAVRGPDAQHTRLLFNVSDSAHKKAIVERLGEQSIHVSVATKWASPSLLSSRRSSDPLVSSSPLL